MDGSGTSSGEGCLVSLRPFVSFSEHVCFRTNERLRFNSEARSADSVAIWTSSEASRPSQQFSSSGEACTRRPSWVTGIPDFAHR